MNAGLLALMRMIRNVLMSKHILFYPHHGLSEDAVSHPQFDGLVSTCSYLPAKVPVFLGLLKTKRDG